MGKKFKIKIKVGLSRRLCLLMFSLFIGQNIILAQYYPSLQPISASKEKSLIASLKNVNSIAGSDSTQISLLIDLANLYLNKPLKKKEDLSLALKYALRANKLSKNLYNQTGYNDSQLLLADIYCALNNMRAAEELLQGINGITKLKITLLLSYRYWSRDNSSDSEDLEKSLHFSNLAREMSVELGLPFYEILARHYIALVHYNQGLPSTEKDMLDVLHGYKQIKYPKLHYILMMLAAQNLTTGNIKRSDYYAGEMIKSMRKTRDTLAAGDFYLWGAIIAKSTGDYKKSLEYSLRAIDSYKIHAAQANLSDPLVLSLPIQNLRKLKRYSQALKLAKYLQKQYPPLSLADKQANELLIGNIYRDMKRYNEADKYFLNALAYKNKEKENELKIKEQNIALLSQNYKLQQTELTRSKLQKNITVGAILVLIIITGLIYKEYISKQRAHKVISQKNTVIMDKNEIISNKNIQLEHLLTEKEWLLKEVHHRVKNNLHTIMCLLESQAAYLENDALTAIENSQNRIYTMSLIHQKLYQSDDITTIEMAGYIAELTQYLKDSFNTSEQIYFRLEVQQVQLDPSIAIPLALIINEALTNSIKYAFPDQSTGEILISLEENGEQMKLEINDNGIGLDNHPERTQTASLGMELIKGLTQEIRGNISIESNNGVKIKVTFKNDMLHYSEVVPEDKTSIG